MKPFLLIFLFCLLISTDTEIEGTYKIETKHSYDTLELKKNGTYKYLSRGGSCWTWSDILGTWEVQNEMLILMHEYKYTEDATEFIEVVDENPNQKVKINIIDNLGKPITNFEVKYSTAYDQLQIDTTNNNGIVVFKKNNFEYSESDFASIRIKYLENGNEISESTSVQWLSDRITISINNNPKTIEKKEKYYFQLKKDGGLKAIKFPYAIENSTYKKL